MDKQNNSYENEHQLHHFQRKIETYIENEFYKVTAQRALYMALHAFALCLFAVVLFFDARRYHDVTLWGIGVCLLLFGLIEFIELDFLTSKSTIIKKFFKKK